MHTRPSRNMPRKGTWWPSLVIWFLLSTVLFWPSGLVAQSTSKSDSSVNPGKPRVLILHSYHHGFSWSDNISRGIRSVFEEEAGDVELRFEFMDTRRIHTEAYFLELKALFDVKYAGTPIDVIIASDDYAFNFMMGLGKDVFPDVPVVFCSVSGYKPSVRQDRQLTGLQESIDIKATLDVALKLHPGTKEVAVITDMTLTGRALKAKAERVFSDYESRLDFSYLEDLTIDGLKQKVSSLSDETIAFLFIFSRDKAGRVFSHEHNLRILAKHCSVPIYAVWEFYLGHGIVGGMLTSGEAEGRMAAEMALRILGGEKASDIPLEKSPNQYMFDYGQLERFNIKERMLPEDSRVINKPFSFYEDYKPLIWSGASAIVFLLLVVTILAGHIVFRRRTERALRESRERYRDIVENVNDVIYAADEKGVITYISPVVESVMGYSPSEVMGKPFAEFMYEDDLPRVMEQFKKIMSGHFEQSEYRLVTKTGEIRWVRTSSRRILEGDRVVGLRGVLRDVTERKAVDEALSKEKAFSDTTIDSLPGAFYLFNDQGKMLRWNKNLEKISGYSSQEISEMRPSDFFAPEDRSALEKAIEGVFSKGKNKIELDILSKDGKKTPHLWTARLVTVNQVPCVVGTGVDITERKRAGDRLARSEAKYRQLFQHAPSAIYEIDFEHRRFITFNDVLPAYTGYSEKELKEMDPLDLFTDHSAEVFLEKLGLMRDGKEVPASQEYEIKRKDGTTIWALINMSYEMEKGMPVKGRMVAHDITERKAMESVVRESEEKYRTLYDNAADIIILADSEGNLMDVNRMFEEESGFSRDEMLGKNLFTSGIMTEVSTARALSAFKELLDGKEWQRLEVDGVRKNGNAVPFEVRAVPIMRKGELQGFQAILRNIRERKKAEEVLRTEKEKFEILVEESPLAVSLIGEDGGYRYTNPKFTEMFGYTLEDIPNGREWFTRAYPDPEYRDEVISAWIADIKKTKAGQARPRTFDVTCRDGSEKVIYFRPVTMHNGDQLVIYEDITQQRRLERRLRQAQKMEAIGTLAGGIAHDFNNILTPIMVQTEVAMQLLPKQSPVQHNLEEVTRAAHRAKNLVKQILTFGRQSKQQRLPLRVGPVLKETMKLLRSSLPTTIEMRQSINVAHDVALTDPTEIHQVLMNLCTNAAHAMGQKGGVLEVRLVDVEIGPDDADRWPDLKPGSYLRLSVSDTGDGIARANMERIFDPFFTTKSREEGTGMGLAVVHGIAKSYGGAITVESEPAKGTTFYFFLPRDDRETPARTKPAGPVPTGDERILLVDDEESVVDTVRLMLEHLGYEVIAKGSSMEALEAFQAEPDRFDLVITDQTMPKMRGKELAQRLISIRANVPVILFTGFGDGITEQEAKAVGISAHLMKPMVIDDMATTIRKLLDKAGRHKKVV